jgi:hypothetical protein
MCVVMVTDFMAFLWLHISIPEVDFLCSVAQTEDDQCSTMSYTGMRVDRVALLATIIVLHALLIVRDLVLVAVIVCV